MINMYPGNIVLCIVLSLPTLVRSQEETTTVSDSDETTTETLTTATATPTTTIPETTTSR